MVRFLVVFIVFYSLLTSATEIEQCKALHQGKERLACYDDYHQYQQKDIAGTEKKLLANKTVKISDNSSNYLIPSSLTVSHIFQLLNASISP